MLHQHLDLTDCPQWLSFGPVPRPGLGSSGCSSPSASAMPDALTNLKTDRAAAAAKAHAVEVEAAPIMYVAQLLGGTTEQAIRWLILAMVLWL